MVLLRVALVVPLGIMYTLPVVRHHRIRDLPYIKIVLISFLWTYLTAYIPRYMVSGGMAMDQWIEFIFYFVAITIPFDIRDKEIDESRYVKTFATLLGKKNSYIFSAILLLICITIELFTQQSIPLMLTYAVVIIWLYTLPRQNEYFSSLWMEVSMILPFLFSWIISLF